MNRLREIVVNRSVALVGNAQSICDSPRPLEIDSHDVVIRMNMGIPPRISSDIVGKKTTVWATAKYWPGAWAADCELVVFMKLTALGDQHWEQMLLAHPHKEMARWPQEHEDACKAYVGADPGTGVRLLWWLKTFSDPRCVNLFGFDCWRTVSHWSGRKNTPNHKPDLERAAINRLLIL